MYQKWTSSPPYIGVGVLYKKVLLWPRMSLLLQLTKSRHTLRPRSWLDSEAVNHFETGFGGVIGRA